MSDMAKPEEANLGWAGKLSLSTLSHGKRILLLTVGIKGCYHCAVHLSVILPAWSSSLLRDPAHHGALAPGRAHRSRPLLVELTAQDHSCRAHRSRHLLVGSSSPVKTSCLFWAELAAPGLRVYLSSSPLQTCPAELIAISSSSVELTATDTTTHKSRRE